MSCKIYSFTFMYHFVKIVMNQRQFAAGVRERKGRFPDESPMEYQIARCEK